MSNQIGMKNVIQLNQGGLHVASFVQIRNAIIERYKAVYGQDIDLSTGNADGIFVNDLALMVNNIVQTMSGLYSNLDVNSASGIYLDHLCALSNVIRKPATRSSASLIITNLSDSQLTLEQNTEFVDKAGTDWTYKGEDLVMEGNESYNIVVECNEIGPIKGNAGWITKAVDSNLAISVEQNEPIIAGTNIESDAELRLRRSQSTGQAGVTVLESLTGALLSLSGIRDVKIYNNNTNSSQISKDNTSIPAHNVYIILRQYENINIDDTVIGNLIYEKMTPGISTTRSSVNTENKSYTHVSENNNYQINLLNQTIYWRLSSGKHDKITITITPFQNFNETICESVGNAIIDYMNSLKIGVDYNQNNIISEIVFSDPKPNGMISFNIVEIEYVGEQTNEDYYFDYSSVSYSKSGSNYVITIE